MSVEAIPRLAVRLSSTFPEASIEVHGRRRLKIKFPALLAREIEVASHSIENQPIKSSLTKIESSLRLRYNCLESTTKEDFFRLIAAENTGLRGVTLIDGSDESGRALLIRASFVGVKGRTRDEAENVAIDVLSLMRFARLLEDRILRSSTAGEFCYEMYHSQYVSNGIGRNRHINYARSFFQGSVERVFGQVAAMLRDDFCYDVDVSDSFAAQVRQRSVDFEINMKIPDVVPMITFSATLHTSGHRSGAKQMMELVHELNKSVECGHFEASPDGSNISFVAWKHLTNDIRYFSIDQIILAIHSAHRLLARALDGEKEPSTDNEAPVPHRDDHSVRLGA